MGTSASSSGPGAGVPLVPSWVPDAVAADQPQPDGDQADGAVDGGAAATRQPAELAPAGRFRGARTNLGKFGRTGSTRNLRRGVAQYTRKGLGGSARAAQRMGGTARKAGVLYGVLDSLSSGTASPVELGVDPQALSGKPAREAIDYIAEAISPIDGTQDAEAARESVALALAELVGQEPDTDLTSLTEDQIRQVVESYIGNDIAKRIELDVGKAVFTKAPDAVTAVRRMGQLRRYVRQSVAASLRKLRHAGEPFSRQSAARLAQRVIRDTFDVFEDYL